MTASSHPVLRPPARGVLRVVLAVAAAGGVVAGHGLSYLLAHPHGDDRADALTGHGHLEVLGAVLVTIGVAAVLVAAVISRRAISRRARFHRSSPRVGALALAQTAAFVGLEVAERVLAGDGDAVLSVATEPAVAVGLVVQPLVALVIAAAIRSGARFIDRLVTAADSLAGSMVPGPVVSPAAAGLRPVVVRSDVNQRGPPSRIA